MHRMHSALVAAFVVVGMHVGGVQSAHAASDISDLLGRWNGFARSMMNADNPIGEVTFDISLTKNRRFEGNASFTGNPETFHVDGTLSADNIFNIQGNSPGGQHVIAHGRLRALGDGSVRIVAAMFKLFDPQGNLLDEGISLLLQSFGGLDWGDLKVPAVQGNYLGDWTSDVFKNPDTGPGGPLMGRADFMVGPEDQTGSQFCAHGTFFDVFLPFIERRTDLMFEFEGTVGLPAVQRGGSMAAPFAGIGANSRGIIAILIGLLLPAVQDLPITLQGRYALAGSFFDVFTDVFRGTNRSFDAGTFSLPAVQ